MSDVVLFDLRLCGAMLAVLGALTGLSHVSAAPTAGGSSGAVIDSRSLERNAKAAAARGAANVPPVGEAKIINPAHFLEEHGVGSSNKELLAFLNRGLPRPERKMPDEPAEKTQLAIDAMTRLSSAHSREAVPVLIQIAALQPPVGVEALLTHDLNNTNPQTREAFRQKALHLLQFNAINALGIIADPAGHEVVSAVFSRETDAAARIQYALCLACLGDAAGVPFLLEQIDLANRRESAAAAKVFTFITGEDYDYTENTPVRARRERARKYRDWWKSNRQLFHVDAAAVMERRLKPRMAAPYQPRSTRDLLKLASFYFDFENKLGSRDARQRLKQGGRALNADLKEIGADVREDLDVRMEALNWYYENNRSDARVLLQRLRRDENPEIAEKAKSLLEQIDADESRNMLGATGNAR